jgi:hypothetical protein
VPTPPKDLILLRLAVVEFRPKLSNWREWSLEEDGIRVATVRVWKEDDGHVRMLVAASQVLEYRPKVTAENEVVVPDQQRAAAEAAIEVAANLIAASQGCRATSPRLGHRWCLSPQAEMAASGSSHAVALSTTG